MRLLLALILATSASLVVAEEKYDPYSENCDIPMWFDMDGPAEQCNPNNIRECFGFYHFNPSTMKSYVYKDGDWIETDKSVPSWVTGIKGDFITRDDIDDQSGYHFDGPTTKEDLVMDAFGEPGEPVIIE